uniref:Xrn1 N-terminal domain-containing protein n=1 Tax=viral metagenome TaxID=1070528 RepID=A0A6C0B957_9ZZZZ
MGIPSYFSHIIRNYSKIVKSISFFINGTLLNNLFLDCNSLIYDAVYDLQKTDDNNRKSDYEFETLVIDRVITSLQRLITLIRPNNVIYIAFDGVAPFAKMEQQRTRRYKSNFMNKFDSSKTVDKKWNTSSITPGTQFMDNLTKRIERAFVYQELKYGVKQIIVSGSNLPGEGEHKIMEFMRSFGKKEETVALYGLDADLIMLSMFHLKYYKNIYVFREAPEFIKNSIQIDSGTSVDSLYFLDIDMFSNCLLGQMDCVCYDKQRIYDYVFMCFILGNDFLPHFPAVNIRTQGIQVLMDIYRINIGNIKDRFLISRDGVIQWKTVGILFKEIAKREHELIKNEYFVREKFDKYHYNEAKSSKEREERLQNCPVIYRSEEKYICPNEPGWEARYYKSLFHSLDKGVLCNNYLEGLEWTFKYYSAGCPDWKWKFNYHYPPLFKDLAASVPHFDTEFIAFKESNHLSPFAQLSYVLPKDKLDLLPEKFSTFLRTNYSELYPDNYEFQWAFCRYFWEAHPILPEVPISLIEQWDTQFKMFAAKN